MAIVAVLKLYEGVELPPDIVEKILTNTIVPISNSCILDFQQHQKLDGGRLYKPTQGIVRIVLPTMSEVSPDALGCSRHCEILVPDTQGKEQCLNGLILLQLGLNLCRRYNQLESQMAEYAIHVLVTDILSKLRAPGDPSIIDMTREIMNLFTNCIVILNNQVPLDISTPFFDFLASTGWVSRVHTVIENLL